MEQKIYSKELAQKILERFHEKGWNLYRCGDVNKIGGCEVIKKNLADKLEIMRRK